MRIFVNNVDGYLAGAIAADLSKISTNIIGTRKGTCDSAMPPVVRRAIPRDGVRRLLKTIASCDVVVYDLHDADLEELELVLRTLYSSDVQPGMVFVIVSSIGVWAKTQHQFEEVVVEDEEDGDAGEVAADSRPRTESAATSRPPDATPAHSSVAADDSEKALAMAAAGEEEDDDEEGEEEEPEQDEAESFHPPPPKTVKHLLPLHSEDHIRRIPAPKFQEWKAIETMALGLAQKNRVRPYVVCAGVPYGLGEEPLLGMFQAAWQSKDSLRVIGEGNNRVPLVHARDVARCVRLVLEVQPPLLYHLAVDHGQVTQRELVEAVAGAFKEGTDQIEVPSVSVGQAVLAELADVLCLDLQMEPSSLITENCMAKPPQEDIMTRTISSLVARSVQAESEQETGSDKPRFKWWCEKGIVENVRKAVASAGAPGSVGIRSYWVDHGPLAQQDFANSAGLE